MTTFPHRTRDWLDTFRKIEQEEIHRLTYILLELDSKSASLDPSFQESFSALQNAKFSVNGFYETFPFQTQSNSEWRDAVQKGIQTDSTWLRARQTFCRVYRSNTPSLSDQSGRLRWLIKFIVHFRSKRINQRCQIAKFLCYRVISFFWKTKVAWAERSVRGGLEKIFDSATWWMRATKMHNQISLAAMSPGQYWWKAAIREDSLW